MTIEYSQLLARASKAKKSIIFEFDRILNRHTHNVTDFGITVSIFLIAGGAIIFCPISIISNLPKYKNLEAMIHQKY